MVGRAAAVVLVVGAGAWADLYAVAVTNLVERRYYRVSSEDASTTLLSVGADDFGLLDITLGTDGTLYGVHGIGIDRIDPVVGTYEWVAEISDNCYAQGAVISRDNALYVGVLLFCSSALWRWDFEQGEFQWGEQIYLLDNFIPGTATLRDDGEILVMGYSGSLDVYAVHEGGDSMALFGSFEEGTVAESFATDPVTGQAYMLGRAPGDVWSLYEIDLYTLALTRVGPVTPSDIVGIAGMPPCAADFNADGKLSILDFVALQLAWQAGDEAADVNGDGVLDVLDFVAFQGLFKEGCG